MVENWALLTDYRALLTDYTAFWADYTALLMLASYLGCHCLTQIGRCAEARALLM